MMELGVMLLCIVGCSLSRATPIMMQGGDIYNTDPDPDKKTIFEIFREVNKDISVFLEDGDINGKLSRSAQQCPGCLWKKSANRLVEIPFVLSPVYGFFEKYMINRVWLEFEMMTCIKFVNRSTEQDYISLESAGGCWSYVGKSGGKQTVSINAPGCIRHNLIQHELIHVLGFYHEHTRKDRDQYIDVLWQNVSPKDVSNFDLDDGDTLDLPYGYNSVMHYGARSYSNTSGQPTMVAKSDPSIPIGQNVGMDNLDVMKINTLYDCNLCRRKFVDPSGTFTFDSTSSSQGGSNCLYLIQSTYLVMLQLSDFNVPSSPDCNDAYVKVYDGIGNSSLVLLNKTCGDGLIPPLTASGSFMLIEIVNNLPFAGSTFNADYKTVRFGGTFLTNNTRVTSPFFPGMYPANVDVVQTIMAPKGYKISLTFSFFRIEYAPKCSIEYLTVRDGPLLTSPILGTYCRFTEPAMPPVVSTGNVMILQFHSVTGTNNGYSATCQFVPIS